MPQHHQYSGGPPADGFAKVATPYHVMLATPARKGDLCVQYLMSMVATVEALTRFGIKFDVHMLDGDCHVDDGRNKIFRKFLETDCTDLFFLDSDLGWRPQDFIRLLKADGDIVAGIYCHKRDGETYPAHFGEGCGRTVREDGLLEMPKLPTGFMRLRRYVIEALHRSEYDKGRYFWDSPEDEASGSLPITAICERLFAHEMKWDATLVADKSNRHSGDLVLCLKARALGYRCFVDLEMPFHHVGDKAYFGHLGNHLRSKQGVDHQMLVDAIAAIRAGHTDKKTFERLFEGYGVVEWPLQASALHALYHAVKDASGHVLETGSGLSTIVMALALEGTNRTLHSLEHDVLYWRATAKSLNRYQLPNVTLHLAPLVPVDDDSNWYGITPDDLPDIGFALIDGPPSKYGRAAIMGVMGDKLRGATLFIDDAARERMATPDHDRDVYRLKDGTRTFVIAKPKAERAAA